VKFNNESDLESDAIIGEHDGGLFFVSPECPKKSLFPRQHLEKLPIKEEEPIVENVKNPHRQLFPVIYVTKLQTPGFITCVQIVVDNFPL
jgi:hypothetical protein